MNHASPQSSLGKSATAGIIWLIAQNISGRLTVFVSQLVLARILLPEDFGVLGLAYTITTVFSIFANVGIDAVLQQRRFKMRLWVTQAFWINLLLTSIIAVAMAVYAPLGAELYHNAKVTELVWIIATSLPIASLSTIPSARLQAQMRFKFLASYNSVELIGIQLMTIILALMKMGAISFVLPIPIAAVARAIIFWKIAPLPLRAIRFSSRWKIMVGRGITLFGSNLALALIEQGDYITLGFYTTAYKLGMYYFAFKLAVQPVRMLAGSFSNVLFPTLVSLSNEPSRQVSVVFKSSETLGVLSVPICFLQAAIAAPALTLLFGMRWQESIPLIQILSLGLALDALSWPLGCLLSAKGEFGQISKYHMLSVVLFFGLVITGVHLGGVTGVAIAVSLYYVIHPVAFSLLVFYPQGYSIYRIVFSYIAPLAIAIVSFGAAYAASQIHALDGKLIIQIMVVTLIGMSAYFAGVRLFLPQTYFEARKQILGILKK